MSLPHPVPTWRSSPSGITSTLYNNIQLHIPWLHYCLHTTTTRLAKPLEKFTCIASERNDNCITFVCLLHTGAEFCKAGAVSWVTHSFLLWHSSNFLVSFFVGLSSWTSSQGIRHAPTEGWGQSQPAVNSSGEVVPSLVLAVSSATAQNLPAGMVRTASSTTGPLSS